MTAPALQLSALRKTMGRAAIVRGVDLAVAQGERHALIGPNGAGKSTLFNLIAGRYAPCSGSIRLRGIEIAGRKPYEINRLGLSRSFQSTHVFGRLSVFDNLRCALLWPLGYRYSFWHRLSGLTDLSDRAEQVLQRIGLGHRRDATAGVLTYAEQRALELGITIAGGADTILLDEPTAGMSRSETVHAVALIREVTAGKTLLLIEHDMSVVFGLADRISVLVRGEIIASGSPAEVRADHRVQAAYLGQYAEGG